MPIRFHCEHCGQHLSASAQKAGAALKCPKCRRRLRVPESEETKNSTKPPPEPSPPEPGLSASSPSASSPQERGQPKLQEFVVFDRDEELVYERANPSPRRLDTSRSDQDKVAVDRRVIYMQGALLGVVALVCFALGVVVGSAVPTPVAQQFEPRPCVVQGRIEFVDDAGSATADSGAVALILPREARVQFDEKQSLETLLPGSPIPGEAHPALAVVRQLGGDYARTDDDGRYELRVPDTGKYFVLFISRNLRRDENTAPDRTHVAQLGRYFLPMETFLDDLQYRWEEQTVDRDQTLDSRFN